MRSIGRLCGSLISTTANRSSSFILPSVAISRSSPRTNINISSKLMSTQLWQLTSQLQEKIKVEDEKYRKASERSWEINAALVRCEMAHERDAADTLPDEELNLDNLVSDTVKNAEFYKQHDNGEAVLQAHPRAPRVGGLDYKMENYARYKAFQHYIAEEKILSPDAPCFTAEDRNVITDEEYLGGACIGLCHDLAKYGVTRASNAVEDTEAVPFIRRARDTVSRILEELLQFDFRNGPLRRKYDSTKYALKTLETVLYELSVAGAVGGHQNLVGDEDSAPVGKKMKIADEDKVEDKDAVMEEEAEETLSTAIPSKEIAALRERMDHRDKLRENLIKMCRDGQKQAKQAIFAMHRGDTKKATKLLTDCEKCVTNDLVPIVQEEPTLRYGSFSGVLEEYVEGKLFLTWLHGDDGGTGNTVGKILLPNEIPLKISTEDYLGGLCDLTGEIGRYAVARGTARDKESVALCLESNKSIYMTLKMLGKLPKNISKKMGMVSKSVEKLERVLYEQSLMEMTGRKEFNSGVETDTFDKDTEDN